MTDYERDTYAAMSSIKRGNWFIKVVMAITCVGILVFAVVQFVNEM